MRRIALLIAFASIIVACGPIVPAVAPLDGVTLTLVAEGLEEPAWLTAPPGDARRLFVLERFGRIRVIEDGVLLDAPALDLTANVNGQGEKGLTGLAFHPDFFRNQKLYVLHNNAVGNSRLVEYKMSATNRHLIDPDSARLILELEQLDFLHQGGYIVFGPEGNLWVTFGDGGPAADPHGHGQNPHTLHGSVLRIDVDLATPYAIPAGNPFANGVDGAPEVWAYGFRNPWRIALDPVNNVIYVADVGQWEWEEINVDLLDEPGKNHGWAILEGETCFQYDDCEEDALSAGLTNAALIYGRADGCAVIGGHVYRGEAIPELSGTYFYGDHCIGWIRSLRLEGQRIVAQTDWTDELGTVPSLMSFGVDGKGEIYVLQRGGRIYRIDAVRAG